MRIIILASLLLLASCTTGTSIPGKSPSSSTPPVASVTRTIATPTYGTGKTQVEIFADFQCPACIATNDTIMPIFEEYAKSGKLMITFRQFPLTMHKNAKNDAIAALCSAEQGKYMDYKNGLYAMEKVKSGKTMSDAERVGLAKSIGLDEAKFSNCLATQAYAKQVEADIALGDSKGVKGTPTIYLNGIKLDMSIFKNLTDFRAFLESQMK